jgi:cell division protein FtsB
VGLRFRFVLAVLAFVVLVLGLRVPQAYSTLRAKHDRIRQLQQTNADLRKENGERRKWIDDLGRNPAMQEKVLRERYHKGRDGETTFMLKPDEQKKK